MFRRNKPITLPGAAYFFMFLSESIATINAPNAMATIKASYTLIGRSSPESSQTHRPQSTNTLYKIYYVNQSSIMIVSLYNIS